MLLIADHPLRYSLADELHARPFSSVAAPSQAIYLAMKPAHSVASPDRAAEMAHLIALLDNFGADHPQPDATHFSAKIGQYALKWESHTEFVTFTIFNENPVDEPFGANAFSIFPDGWLPAAPGARITSALINVEVAESDLGIREKAADWFVPESLAISRVLDDALVVAADFRIDHNGHMRFAVFARPETGNRRIGRVVQRLCEIETYKAMAMFGLTTAREMGPNLTSIDARLTHLLSDMSGITSDPADVLMRLLEISTEIESIGANAAYRFAATQAYEKIVNQRIEVLREESFHGRQSFGEFMMRRFDPAMRTVNAMQRRLDAMSARALRAGELLRTRVDVARSAQNQALLTSMDKRADQQLRLQKTVEGISVVAISYYAVNIALYVLGPFSGAYDLSKTTVAALVTPVVITCVWLMVRRVHKHME
jgi:uncharacterized membrane-anchored protein